METAETVNPSINIITTEVKNKDTLARITKHYEKLEKELKTPLPTRQNDWFSKKSLLHRAQQDTGGNFTIDIFSDQRFVTSYLQYLGIKHIPTFELKQAPAVSQFSYIAYLQIMFNAYLLYNDLAIRTETSYHALPWENTNERMDYLNTLMAAYIPEEFAQLLKRYAAFLDPLRPDLEYVPTLAGHKWAQDFGRLTPPQLFIHAHNLIGTIRPNVVVADFMRMWYDTNIITVNNRDYRISNFIGGYYAIAPQVFQHANWINQRYETIFAPAVGRAHLQRPTLSHLVLTPQVVATPDPNIYDFMLCYNDDDKQEICALVKDISDFIQNSVKGSVPLSDVFPQTEGLASISHTIEPAALPTWHFLTRPGQAPLAAEPTRQTHMQYAAHVHYLDTAPQFHGQIPIPQVLPNDWVEDLYRVSAADYDPAAAPYVHKTFDASRDLMPPVLLCTPYKRDLKCATISETLGLKIEAEEFDSIAIPVPNARISLNVTNSDYLIGSIPELFIKPVIISRADNHRIRICQRAHSTVESQPNGFAIRDMSINALPIFANDNVDPNIHEYQGLQRQENYNTSLRAWTFTAWKRNETPQIPQRSMFLWSSYRYVENAQTPDRRVHMYYTMRGFNGIGENLSRTEHPSKTLNIT